MVDNRVDALLKSMGFSKPVFVGGRKSVADLFRPRRRCGLYVLHFADGWNYAGQAVDVVRRYAQHRHIHTDIERLSFKPMAKRRLDQEEKTVIRTLDRDGVNLRNISLVSTPQIIGEVDFDLNMTPEAQRRWTESTLISFGSPERVSDPALRTRYQARYERFLELPDAEPALLVLQTYAQMSLPVIRDSELSFWSCTCFPQYVRKDLTVYARINIYWQEVFNISTEPGSPLGFSWHLALSPLERSFGTGARRLERRYPFVELFDHKYEPGGQDQVQIFAEEPERVVRVIHDPDVMRAVREFNLRLMRKGPCTFSRYHCFDLADQLVQ